jgi:hypothetical protein
MERIKKPILALLSAVVFWILAIASSPQIGQSVECTKLPEPITKTHYVLMKVSDFINDQSLQNVTIKLEQKNLATVEVSPGDCKLSIVSTSEQVKTTSDIGTVQFAVIETKIAPVDYAQVFFTVSLPGYNEATWSFSTFTSEGSVTKHFYLTPKEMYP